MQRQAVAAHIARQNHNSIALDPKPQTRSPSKHSRFSYMEYNGDLFRHYIRNYWYEVGSEDICCLHRNLRNLEGYFASWGSHRGHGPIGAHDAHGAHDVGRPAVGRRRVGGGRTTESSLKLKTTLNYGRLSTREHGQGMFHLHVEKTLANNFTSKFKNNTAIHFTWSLRLPGGMCSPTVSKTGQIVSKQNLKGNLNLYLGFPSGWGIGPANKSTEFAL